MTLAPGMRDPDSNADRRTRVSEQLRRRAQTARFLAASRRREFVTVRRFAPNSFLEAHITRFQQMMEPDRNTFSRFPSCCRWWRRLPRPTRARRFRTRAIGRVRLGRAHKIGLVARKAI